MVGNLCICLLPILYLAVDHEPDLVSNFPALGSVSSYSKRLCIGSSGEEILWDERAQS